MLAELKQTFLEAYDENADGKIDIREVSGSHWRLIGARRAILEASARARLLEFPTGKFEAFRVKKLARRPTGQSITR